MKEKISTFMKKQIIHDVGVSGKVVLYQVMAILMICGVLYLTNFTVTIAPRVVSPIPEGSK